jgi:hypothetical protein
MEMKDPEKVLNFVAVLILAILLIMVYKNWDLLSSDSKG